MKLGTKNIKILMYNEKDFVNLLNGNIETFDIPEGVKSIKRYLFYNCPSLTSVTIPDSVTNIYQYAFKNSGIESIIIPDSVTSLDSRIFEDCIALKSVILSNSLIELSPSLFVGCTSLTSITIPDSVTSIRSSVFENCTSLTSIAIPNSVTDIYDEVFSGCTSLSSVTIGNSVTSIRSSVFENCTSLTSITIPDSVEYMDQSIFQNCTSLKSAILSNSLADLEQSLFEGCISLESVTIGTSAERINSGAFKGCTSLKSIIIPDSVKYIDWEVFSGCTSLSSVTLGKSVGDIDNEAFYNCTSLTSITIPSSISRISSTAFSGCTNLTSITVEDKYEDEISDAPWGATNATVTWTGGGELTINTTPADASVTFSTGKISGHQTKVKKGTAVTYTVSKDGYYSVSGSLTVTENKVIDIVLEQIYYNDGQVLWESGEAGASANLNLLTTGRYQVICIAGGGGAAKKHAGGRVLYTSGGSGSGFDCVFRLVKGNYAIQVGNGGSGYSSTTSTDLPGKRPDGGNSHFGDSYAYGGGGATLTNSTNMIAGVGGAAPTLVYTVLSSVFNQAGNSGGTSTSRWTYAFGGASIYGSYGKGGDCIDGNDSVINGNAGYVKVIFLGR